MVKKVIDLHASWCQPCKAYSKTFETVRNKEEYKNIVFEDYDIEDDKIGEDLVTKYGVRSVPTTLFFDENENLLHSMAGNISMGELEKKLA